MTKGQVSVARRGNIYFSGRVLTERTPAIFVCRYVDGRYSPPERLAGPLAAVPLLVDPWWTLMKNSCSSLVHRRRVRRCPTDIGISYRQADGSWGLPVRLGGAVNTPAFERFPSLSRDGKIPLLHPVLWPAVRRRPSPFYWVDARILEAAGRSQGQRESQPGTRNAPKISFDSLQ